MSTEHAVEAPDQKISCETCVKEIPVSEAHIDEAADYIVHFCGLECFAQWKAQLEEETAASRNPGSVRA